MPALDPGNAIVRNQYALVLARNGKPSEAKAQYDAVKQLEADSERIAVLINGPLQNTPNDPQIHYEIGMIALRSGLTTEAIRWFTGALAVDPNHLPTHRILASVYHELENPVLSARHRASQPDCRSARQAMSNDHRFRGRLALRRALFAALTALLLVGIVSPQAWAWYQFHTAEQEMARHHPAEARRPSKNANGSGHRPYPSASSRVAARQEGDLEDAIAELRECQRLSGGATEATAFEWALIQAAGGNVREVEEYLQKQAESSPEIGPLVWEALAEEYALYRTLDAMACLNHWLDRDHDNLRALELRGMTYVAGKGVQRGAEDFRKVLSIDPDRKQTRMRLTACLLDLGSYDEAAENLEWSLRQSPGDPDIIARLARCYFMLKHGAGGAASGRRCSQTAPRSWSLPSDTRPVRSIGGTTRGSGAGVATHGSSSCPTIIKVTGCCFRRSSSKESWMRPRSN